MDTNSIRKRASDLNLSHVAWAKLTSSRGQKIWQPEISAWLSGAAPLKSDKQERLVAMLEELERMVATSPVKIDMRTTESIEQALAVMPSLVEAHRRIIIEENSGAPATFTPAWPARSAEGAKVTSPKAAELLSTEIEVAS